MEESKKLVGNLEPSLRQIVYDSHLGSAGDNLLITKSAPTSVSAAEITFELKLVNSAVSVVADDLLGLVNGARDK